VVTRCAVGSGTVDSMDRLDLASRGFGRAAEAYDRGRPGYPPEAIALLADALELGSGVRVADVGAGTGKLTALLAPTGAELTAVEPIAAMRERLLIPSVRVLEGTAEQLPLEDDSVDAIAAGQAFHWFDGPAALAEFARVLRPGGRLGLIWNARDERVGWVAQLSALIDPYQGDAPRHARREWLDAFDDQPWFAPPAMRSVTHDHRLPVAAMIDRFGSISFIAALDEAERRDVLRRVETVLLHVADDERTVTMPYRTDVYWTRVGTQRSECADRNPRP
jgi:SAM-dependent methyltransferase